MKISILTPSFNSGKYIKRAIESVLIQQYKHYEHIIADGGSTDKTLSIIQSYEHLVYTSGPDLGQSDAMNKAFKMSDGEIIVYLNADDEFLPGAFNKIISAFENDPNSDMIVGDLIYQTEDKSITRVPSSKYIDIVLYWKNLFPNNPVSYFYKRQIQEEIGAFPLDNHFAMDLWFLLKVYIKFKVVKIDYVLGIFHSDNKNKTSTVDTGYYLHKTVKTHLKKENPIILFYFYSKLFWGRLKSNFAVINKY
jgi:glycosyltransferase involved in cell wall biosynthesis